MRLARFLTLFFLSFYLVFFLLHFDFIKQKIKDFYEIEKIQELILRFKKQEMTKSVQKTEKEDSLLIPKLNLDVPLLLANDSQEAGQKLKEGVVLYLPESSFPVEQGKIVILGHSAPAFWVGNKYDNVFSKISDLIRGDKIFVYFNEYEYRFVVQEKYFLEKGDKLPEISGEKGVLFLISCWPPGKDERRIVILATLPNL